MVDQHRQLDSSTNHEDECWAKHHQHDLRLTIMETKVGSIEGVIGTICEKHEVTNTTLDRLAGLFTQFLSKFESHSLKIEDSQKQNEARQRAHEVRLEQASKFQTQVTTAWRVVSIVALCLSIALGAVYTITHDIGIIPQVHTK